MCREDQQREVVKNLEENQDVIEDHAEDLKNI
jgi:hypothetical protein